MTIIHRDYRFIFLRSHKTASTSIELFLVTATALGGDIYHTSKDIQKYDFPRKRNSHALVPGQTRYWRTPGRGVRIAGKLPGVRHLFPVVKQHTTAAEVRRLVGSEFWPEATRAVPVRNPWDTLVSDYEWFRTGRLERSEPVDLDWNQWLEEVLQPGQGPGGLSPAQYRLFYPYLMVDGQWVADHMIFFEAIEDSLQQLGEALDIDMPSFEAAGIHEKKNRKRRDYRSYFSDAQAEQVAEHFRAMLARAPYDFDAPGTPPA